MSSYRLFIDDDARKPGLEEWRYPPAGESDWKIATSTKEAKAIILQHGIPIFIDFDHDLGLDEFGNEDKALIFLKWLQDAFPAAIDQILGYNIHSQNSEGAKNIRAFMESWARSRILP